jgi:hypothetical protein
MSASPQQRTNGRTLQQAAVQTPDLFDHLVGNRKQRRRHSKAEHPSGLEVDDQLELARLYDRQVRRPGALEDAAGIDADLTKRIRNVGRGFPRADL